MSQKVFLALRGSVVRSHSWWHVVIVLVQCRLLSLMRGHWLMSHVQQVLWEWSWGSNTSLSQSSIFFGIILSFWNSSSQYNIELVFHNFIIPVTMANTSGKNYLKREFGGDKPSFHGDLGRNGGRAWGFGQLAELSWRLQFSIKPYCTSSLDQVFWAVSHFGLTRNVVLNNKTMYYFGRIRFTFGGFFL